MRIRVVLIILNLIAQKCVTALICSRFPSNTLTPKSPVDENFAILINNNPQTYILGQEYNITINAYNGHRFVSFSLALENDNGVFSINEDLGQFKISDPVETRFSPNCINMVESTNTHPKIRSEVTWIAPTDPNSGCVLIRATLLQHRDVWHMDDGGLTRRICQEVVDEVENRRAYDAQECCACDEARYELTFQGVWNRNLHPKDFPPQGWIARFGDIIGAAHIADYRFWKDGELASDGMKEYAEHGSSRTLEKEFNVYFQEGVIRTIIKARGPAFPNLNGISVASVRVDPKHHIISLASKIDPSPDWFVGVSGMELCMQNCTWLEEKVIQLYPWDAGTDAGPSYTSADQPQVPPDVIRRMRSNFPNDPRSPFYDATGAAMAPFATLIVKRQRVYERTCEDNDSNNENVPRECHTHPWTSWSECSASCGDGHSYRTRVYKQPELAKMYNCDAMITLREDQNCKGRNCYGPDAILGSEESFYDDNEQQNSPECRWKWSEWSECSKTCGEGTTMRRREFKNIRTQEACQTNSKQNLQEIKKCHGKLCMGDLADNRRRDYSIGSENVDEDEDAENGIYNGGDARENGANQYWNSADRYNQNNARGQQYWNGADGYNQNNARGQQSWNGGVYNGREDERDQNQFWRTNQRDTAGRGGNNKNHFNAIEPDNDNGNEAYESEDPDMIEQNLNNFEIGNLQKGRIETNNYRKVANGYYMNPNNINQHNRQSTVFQQFQNQRNNSQVREDIPELLVPSYCFEKLHVFNCLDPKVVRNSWFYNYCEDECMLFAEDRCDRNENKFSSLEACEATCRCSKNKAYLRYQQERTCSSADNRRSNKRKKNNSWKSY